MKAAKKWIVAFSVITTLAIITVTYILSSENTALSDKSTIINARHASEDGTQEPLANKYSASADNTKTADSPDFEKRVSPGSPKQKAYFLPSEASFLNGNSISAARTERILMSKDFSKVIDSLRNESSLDSEANDASLAYENYIRKQYTNSATSRMIDFKCGLSLCVGVARETAGDHQYQTWSDALLRTGRPPTFGYTDFPQQITDTEIEHRFVFSIDPNVNSLGL
ncbi:MAG TPA: hypothetical protein VF471_11500 [Pseudoxanthomonas sp.]